MGIVNRIAPAEEIERVVREPRDRDRRERAADASRDEGDRPPPRCEARGLPPGEDADIVEMCYTSADFREGVTAFLEKRPRRGGQGASMTHLQSQSITRSPNRPDH